VKADRTKYTFIFCHQNAGQNRNFIVDNKFLDNMTKYMGTRIRDQIYIHDEI